MDSSPTSATTPLTPSRRIITQTRDVRKPRNLAALGVFGVVVARAVWHQVQERWLVGELMAAFDGGEDHHLSSTELSSLLRANGFDVNQEQVGRMFGRVDDEGDGFDDEELQKILTIVSDLPAISERVRQTVTASNAWLVDTFLCIAAGVGLYYMVGQSDVLEKRWLQSSFRGAVQFHRMQAKCSKLDSQLNELSEEREKVEKAIKEVEDSSFSDIDEREQKLKRLGSRLAEVTEAQNAATAQLQSEVSKWQRAAEKSMQEATQVKSKLKGMMTCIKGLEAFTGAGGNKFDKDGAQQGFCHRSKIGFCMDTITFGTIENGKLLLFETSTRNKIGEGRDCAYRCKEVETGEEFALKMYTMSNPTQRRSIFHDLYAHQSQVGKHPQIVSYERVIESENTIFVLMEYLKGKDLFDIVCQRQLTEAQARPLFKELVEGVQHLHRSEVIHCDIKPENAMVLGSVDMGTATLKLIDFGCSCFNKFEHNENEIRACVVYDSYMPPEHSASPSLAPSVATDMWRIGCTLFVMLVRRPPFHNDAQTKAGREAREQGNFFRVQEYEDLSDEAKDLITSLLNGDPSKRPDTDAVLQHPWVTKGQAS
eukprot:gb/GFBE01026577.1/.p1 GENE.gb/GFBE01026577.1/~~gb/GFBE01026577.1/.p1  ORF type:complete len:595 (+),score=144.50 gb/GFBE01026577.1/:1-1785(+)